MKSTVLAFVLLGLVACQSESPVEPVADVTQLSGIDLPPGLSPTTRDTIDVLRLVPHIQQSNGELGLHRIGIQVLDLGLQVIKSVHGAADFAFTRRPLHAVRYPALRRGDLQAFQLGLGVRQLEVITLALGSWAAAPHHTGKK